MFVSKHSFYISIECVARGGQHSFIYAFNYLLSAGSLICVCFHAEQRQSILCIKSWIQKGYDTLLLYDQSLLASDLWKI